MLETLFDMSEPQITPNSPKAWLLAARPKTLAAAAVPVMVGLALAWRDTGQDAFSVIPAVLCVLFAFIMQVDANFINDYFDCLKGNDDETRLGPLRACSQGWIEVRLMRRAIVLTTVVACLVGLPLVLYGGLEMIIAGALCVLFCFLYTTVLSYWGLGDLLVMVFFGIVPVCLTYYLQTSAFAFDVFMASVSCGLVIDTLLIVNNYRDIENDRRAGKKTMIVRIGAEAGRMSYFMSGLFAVLIGLVFLLSGNVMAFAMPFVYLALHFFAYLKMVRINKGKALNGVLGDTARNIFIYGLLVSLGILIG